MRYTDYKFHVPEEKIVRLIVDTRECGNDSSPLWKRREDGMERCYRDPERVLYAAVRPG